MNELALTLLEHASKRPIENWSRIASTMASWDQPLSPIALRCRANDILTMVVKNFYLWAWRDRSKVKFFEDNVVDLGVFTELKSSMNLKSLSIVEESRFTLVKKSPMVNPQRLMDPEPAIVTGDMIRVYLALRERGFKVVGPWLLMRVSHCTECPCFSSQWYDAVDLLLTTRILDPVHLIPFLKSKRSRAEKLERLSKLLVASRLPGIEDFPRGEVTTAEIQYAVKWRNGGRK